MRALVIGGEQHGTWIDTLDGARMWVDIVNACRHVLRKVTWNVQNISTGEVLEAYTIYVAVHEQLQGPNEPAVVSQLLNLIAMNAYARENGERQEIPVEPAGASLVVPGE